MRLFPSSSSSSSNADKEPTNGKANRHMLYLNVYDLTPVNNYLYLFGLGIYHSGIEGMRISVFFLSLRRNEGCIIILGVVCCLIVNGFRLIVTQLKVFKEEF